MVVEFLQSCLCNKCLRVSTIGNHGHCRYNVNFSSFGISGCFMLTGMFWLSRTSRWGLNPNEGPFPSVCIEKVMFSTRAKASL